MPHINRLIESDSFSRKSTHLIPSKKRGSLGFLGASGRRTGITGQARLTNSRKNASISTCCQGPMPSFPTNTAADLICLICFSKRRSQGKPGRNCHSSTRGECRVPRVVPQSFSHQAYLHYDEQRNTSKSLTNLLPSTTVWAKPDDPRSVNP